MDAGQMDIRKSSLLRGKAPLASPRLLWRMKVVTHREKDAADLVFLRYWFAERRLEPPRST